MRGLVGRNVAMVPRKRKRSDVYYESPFSKIEMSKFDELFMKC